MSDITEDEYRVATAVQEYWATHGRGPTYEQIGEMTGSSKSTAWRRVQQLIKHRLLEADETQHRTVSLIPEEIAWWEVTFDDGATVIVSAEDNARALRAAMFAKRDIASITDAREFTGTLTSVIANHPKRENLEVVFQISPEEMDS